MTIWPKGHAARCVRGCWMLLLMLFGSAVSAIESTTPEYELKAVLLFRLGRFATFAQQSDDAFRVCVYNQNPFGGALDKLAGQSIGGRTISVHEFTRLDSRLQSCNILFVSRSAASHLGQILLAVSHSVTLTVSDIENFADSGGMIEFTSVGQRIGFRINLDSVRSADIKIASPLLELATIVSRRGT